MMGQPDGQRDSDEPESPARRGRMSAWLRPIAACVFALTLGFGHAYADSLANNHEGGQGLDKSHGATFASAEAAANRGDGGAKASSSGKSEALGGIGLVAKPSPQAKATVVVDIDETGIGTSAWSRTVTRTITSTGWVKSVTRSYSYAADEEGNLAIAKAIARAGAPNNVAAVRNGAGDVFAKTSVDVTGNGIASANAGGSIGISGGKVTASTWGETSAEVF
jgi:hypothetical protein